MKKNFKNIFRKFLFVKSEGYYLNIKPNNDEDKNINQSKENDKLRSRFQQHLSRWFLLPCSCKCKWREVQQELHQQKTSDPISQRIAERINVILLAFNRQSPEYVFGFLAYCLSPILWGMTYLSIYGTNTSQFQ